MLTPAPLLREGEILRLLEFRGLGASRSPDSFAEPTCERHAADNVSVVAFLGEKEGLRLE